MLQEYIAELKKIRILPLEEEKDLWPAIAQGSEEARHTLIMSYQPLVFKTAMAFKLHEKQQQMELIQEGQVGLIEAVERFEYKRGVAFSLFAVHRIRGRMLDYLRVSASGVPFAVDFFSEEAAPLLARLVEGEAGPEEIVEERFLFSKINQLMSRLPEKEEKVLRGLYLDHLAPDVLAKAIKVSRAHIYRLQKQGVRRIRGMASRLIHELKL